MANKKQGLEELKTVDTTLPEGKVKFLYEADIRNLKSGDVQQMLDVDKTFFVKKNESGKVVYAFKASDIFEV